MLGDNEAARNVLYLPHKMSMSSRHFAHSGICTRIYTGSAVEFLFILLHLSVPRTTFDKQVTVFLHSGETFPVQQGSDAALQCLYPSKRCFNKLLY